MISKFWKLFRSFPKQRTTDSKVDMVVHGISAVGHDMVLYDMIYIYAVVWYCVIPTADDFTNKSKVLQVFGH